MEHGPLPERIRLSGFNNLTKILSFNLYDFCIALNDEQKNDYINYIHEKYSAEKITKISEKIVSIIEANIISVSQQDYDPVGASTMVLMSDVKGGGWADPGINVSMHLDKSHITSHTYPDASDPNGICTFRVDIDIATCGEIIPLKAINELFDSFECDIVFIDYVVRGYTRLENGKKIYNDHYFNTIQEFIRPDILSTYKFRSDINMPNDNIWQTKLLIRDDLGPERYLQEPSEKDNPLVEEKMKLLHNEMREVFHLMH